MRCSSEVIASKKVQPQVSPIFQNLMLHLITECGGSYPRPQFWQLYLRFNIYLDRFIDNIELSNKKYSPWSCSNQVSCWKLQYIQMISMDSLWFQWLLLRLHNVSACQKKHLKEMEKIKVIMGFAMDWMLPPCCHFLFYCVVLKPPVWHFGCRHFCFLDITKNFEGSFSQRLLYNQTYLYNPGFTTLLAIRKHASLRHLNNVVL